MPDDTFGAAGDLQPKWSINFKTRSTLALEISQPLIVDNPVGLVVFGDTSTIYLAQVADPGADAYSHLPTIKATTYIHGWTVNSGRLYVLDGVELSAWDLRDGQKRESIKLLKGDDAAKATEALGDLKKAIQRVEWATLLEQAEDDWVRLTRQQSAAQPLSEERDRLDLLASDYFHMLVALRKALGSVGGSSAARQLIAESRRALAEKRRSTARWCFSPPVVRRHSFEEPLRAIFAIQGNGTLHFADKSLAQPSSMKWKEQAELQLALLEDPKSPLKLIGYVSNSTLYVLDARTLEEKSHWSPDPAPAAGTNHTLVCGNGQFWWSTDAGVYALQPDEQGRIRLTCQSGTPWNTRQVGRLNSPAAPYDPPVNPNELFDKMNVRRWIEQRANPSVPLNDGITAQLILSDEAGKYTTPPSGTSYILHGPFERDARSAASRWTHIKPHFNSPLVLLADSRGATAFCRYPAPGGVSQLVPQWSVAPWLRSVTPHSAIDVALSQDWPTPGVRPLSKPKPDMVSYLLSSSAGKPFQVIENLLKSITKRKSFGDRDLRYILWHALYDREMVVSFLPLPKLPETKSALRIFFDDQAQRTLRDRFGTPGTTWDIPSYRSGESAYYASFVSATPPVNFDPPSVWKTPPPTNLFHSAPPDWYDPWGYNRPGDFETAQPSPTYLDPFCFEGNLRFPQRPVTLEVAFNGRSWAVFTDNDPASLLASAKPPVNGEAAEEPVVLRASSEPSALVVTADEDRQRTTFQLLPPKPLRITFDTANHTLRNEQQDFGSIAGAVVAPPTVYLSPGQRFPTAWCVANPDFSSARLRKLAAFDPDKETSPWDKFIEDNKSQFGPRDGSKTWDIERCPLPSSALPLVVLQGYDLPAPV